MMNHNLYALIRYVFLVFILAATWVQSVQLSSADAVAASEPIIFDARWKITEQAGQMGGRYKVETNQPALLSGCEIDFNDPDYAPFSVGTLKWIWLTNFEKVSPTSNDVWGCFAIVDGVPGEVNAKIYLYKEICKNVGDVGIINDNSSIVSKNTAIFNGKNYFNCPFRFASNWQSATGVMPLNPWLLQNNFWVKSAVEALQTTSMSSSNILAHTNVQFGLSQVGSPSQIQLGTALTDQTTGGIRQDLEQITSVGSPFSAKFELKTPPSVGQSNLLFSLKSPFASLAKPATNTNSVVLQFNTNDTFLQIGKGLNGKLNQVIMDPSCCI